ncbi:hypothetical protein [Nonomuraea sp. B1E8]|uniref:hypothetical protein n=1 Tax=unclassified Nonomuraea TaxID=2593643 RepID=UPI00325EA0CD
MAAVNVSTHTSRTSMQAAQRGLLPPLLATGRQNRGGPGLPADRPRLTGPISGRGSGRWPPWWRGWPRRPCRRCAAPAPRRCSRRSAAG